MVGPVADTGSANSPDGGAIAGRIVGDHDPVADGRTPGRRDPPGNGRGAGRLKVGTTTETSTSQPRLLEQIGPDHEGVEGEVQKHSTASRGVQTIGSPRVLNEVLTNTGTPVRRSKAEIRS